MAEKENMDAFAGASVEEDASPTWKTRLQVNRRLIALKFLIFLMNGATSVMYPFFIIHCLSMGLTLTESGIIFALIPVFGSLGNPLAGFLADKLGNYKKVVISFILLSVVCHAVLGFAVPAYSNKIVATSTDLIPSGLSFDLKCSENISALYFSLENDGINDSCTIKVRHNSSSQIRIDFCTKDCSADQEVCTVLNQTIKCLSWRDLTGGALPPIPPLTRMANSTFWVSNDTNFLSCLTKGPHPDCAIKCQTTVSDGFYFTCNDTVITGNRLTTFFLYTIFRVIGAMAVSSVMMLIDSATILMVKEHKGDFGMNRAFGLIGNLAFPPLGGYLIGVATAANHQRQQDYSPIFYLFCSMFTVGAVIVWLMDLHIKPPGKEIWSTVWKLLHNVKVSSFVIVVFLLGCYYGILENYLFWYMQTFMKAPKWLLGMTNTVAALSAIPVVAASSFIIKYLGHTKIFMISFILYGVRFLAYSFVYDPYLILPVEILEAFTFSLTFVTATIYSGKIAPAFVATLQGVVGAMHFSVGRGLGSLIAGALFDHLRPRLVYQIVAAASMTCGVIYAGLYYLWLRKAPDPKAPGPEHAALPVLDVAHQSFIPDVAKEGSDAQLDDEVRSALLETDHPAQTYSLSPHAGGEEEPEASRRRPFATA